MLSTRTASLLRPYKDAPDTTGKLLIDAQKIDAYVRYLNTSKIPLAIHAIGDKAVKTALNSFEKMGSTSVGNRIEHIELIDLKDVDRFKALGVYPSMQPNHGTGVIGKYIEDRVGNRDKFTYMWNTLNKKSEGNLRKSNEYKEITENRREKK